MDKDNNFVQESETYETIMFSSISQHVLSMVCEILGYHSDKVVDYTVLGLVRAIFPCTTQTIAIFFFAQFIVDSLHFQLTEFSLNRSCNYRSFLVYLLLFF